MRQQNLHLKCSHASDLLAPNIYEVDLSNEEICTYVDQEAAKISEVKVGGQKKNYDSAQFTRHCEPK